MEKTYDISIIIVNYNSGTFLKTCIDSIVEYVKIVEYEIIVVDNNSSDNSICLCDCFKENQNICFIESKENLGFSKANNLGVSKAKGNYLHFLNPDTRLTEKINEDYLYIINDKENDGATVYVNPLKNRDNSINYEKNHIPTLGNHLKYILHIPGVDYYYIGATLIISYKLFSEVGQWNDEFFMYGEDMEIFYRLHKHKVKIKELSNYIEHYGGACSDNAFTSLKRESLIQQSFRKFFFLHRTMFEYWIILVLILLHFFNRPKRMFWQIKAIKQSFHI